MWAPGLPGYDNPTPRVQVSHRTMSKRSLLRLAGLLALASPAAAQAAEYPFYDGFETGTLGTAWSVHTTEFSQWQLSSQFEPYAGSQHLQLTCQEVATQIDTGIDLRIDLSGRQGVALSYRLRRGTYGVWDEEGLYLSEDGVQFVKAYAPSKTHVDLEYNSFVFDLDALASDAGLTYTKDFTIRYLWTGQNQPYDGGVFLDEFSVKPSGFTTLHTLDSPAPVGNGRFGSSGAAVGDLDGDGLDDYAVGHPGYSFGRGRVTFFAGGSHAVIGHAQKGLFGEQMGSSMAGAGDRDGDGLDELIVGAPSNDLGATDAGVAYLVEPKSGAILTEFYGIEPGEAHGSAVCSAGDLDGDGIDELLVASPTGDTPGGKDAGRVTIYRGSDFGILGVLEGTGASHRMGTSMAAGEDFDGDGVCDLFVGVPGWGLGSGPAVGAVQVFSGAGFGLLQTFAGSEPDSEEGYRLALLPDLDSDGRVDLAVGAPAAQDARGQVRVLSGKTGVELGRFVGKLASERFGSDLALAGDVSGFGQPGLAIGSDSLAAGTVTYVGLPDLVELQTGQLLEQGTGFGSVLTALGDVTGDGFDDLLVGEPILGIGTMQKVGRAHLVMPSVVLLSSLTGVHCMASGEVVITGVNLNPDLVIRVDGVDAAYERISENEVRLSVAPQIPGASTT